MFQMFNHRNEMLTPSDILQGETSNQFTRFLDIFGLPMWSEFDPSYASSDDISWL